MQKPMHGTQEPQVLINISKGHFTLLSFDCSKPKYCSAFGLTVSVPDFPSSFFESTKKENGIKRLFVLS